MTNTLIFYSAAMNDTPHRDGLRAELKDVEFATAYFVRAAHTGDRDTLMLAVDDILARRGGSLVRLTKRGASLDAAMPPGSWDSYRLGDPTNETSLPVDYTVTGILLVPPQLGAQVKILRLSRNGVEIPGVYESTSVIALAEDGFTTLNSDYLLEFVAKTTEGNES